MISKKVLYSAVLILFVFNSYSQDDEYKNCIKRTTISVYKAQKQMLVTHSKEAHGKLAKAVVLQSNALKSYGDHSNPLSVCYSLLARQYALDIIQSLSVDSKVDPYYQISKEEKQLEENCLVEDQLYKQGKNNFSNYSENDMDYLDPLALKNYIEIK